MLLFCIAPAIAQVKTHPASKKKPVIAVKQAEPGSPQLKNFLAILSRANITFTFPAGFKEITAPDNEDLSFDYALSLPGKDFEIWFQVKSQKENYAAYLRSLDDNATRQANPDSLYLGMGTAQALALVGDKSSYFMRTIPPKICARYNADAGRSYLLNLLDLPVTRHYKYALLVTLQKDHTGTILAVCFANEKGPEFFKDMDRASNCLKFKP